MRSVTASLVGWSGRGPALLAMGCPCRELRTRRVCAACRPIGEALMPLTVPPSLLIVVEVLRPCFTAPWFATMSSLVTGALSASGPRTVTGMWQAAGLAGQAHWSRAHRFFARAVWDPDRVGLALARAVVASLAPDGAAVTVAVDDTLFHRYGRKVHGAKYQHDGSARGRDGIGRGNCFVIVGVVAAVPFLARQVCLPALFRLHIPKTGASKTEQARPYTLAPATTDLTSTGEQIVARYASRWSSNSRSRTARTSWAPAEINQQVLGNLDQIIAALEADQALPIAQEVADAR